MFEIVQKIQAIPLDLSKEDSRILIDILTENAVANIDGFEAAVAKSKKEDGVEISPKIITFAHKWLELAEALEALEVSIAKTWGQLYPKNKIIGADEIMQVKLYLLPEDQALLESLAVRLTAAVEIQSFDKANCYITGFHGVVQIRKENETANHPASDQEQRAATVAKELLLQNRIQQLKSACKEYLNCLLESYKEKSLTDLDEKAFIHEVQDLYTQTPLVPKSSRCYIIWNQCKTMGIMYFLLLNDAIALNDKYDVFTQKLIKDLNVLKQNPGVDFKNPLGHFHFDLFANPFSENKEKKLLQNILRLYKNSNAFIDDENTRKLGKSN